MTSTPSRTPHTSPGPEPAPTVVWPAPTAGLPVDAVVAVPGSKSLTNRELLLAALADGPGVVRLPLVSRDSVLMADGLTALGAEVTHGDDYWQVTPGPLRGPARVDCGLAGTVARFLPPVAALAEGEVAFDGDPRMRDRPLGPLVTALRALGADVDDHGTGRLPLTIRGHGALAGGAVSIDASASSQFVSGLLLSAPRFTRGLDLRHTGPALPSLPHVHMSVDCLRRRGVEVDDSEPGRWVVRPGAIGARDVTTEPDLSNAAPFLAAALVCGGRVTVPGWPHATTQPGDMLRDLLGRIGATVTLDAAGLTVRGDGQIHGIDADLHDVGELTPVLAALLALADTPSRLSGIAHLRGHETDRLAALASQLNGLGGDVRETDDGLVIRPRPLHGGRFATYHDHRMATAAAVLGLAVPGIEVENIAATAKTMPDFPTMWARVVR